jgi:Bacterial EndoU nuclease
MSEKQALHYLAKHKSVVRYLTAAKRKAIDEYTYATGFIAATQNSSGFKLATKIAQHAGQIEIGANVVGALLTAGGSAVADSTIESLAASEAESSLTTGDSLISISRAEHLLYGDETGGGHLWPGAAGKTPFPASWSAADVLRNVSEVATNPDSTWIPSGSRIMIQGSASGVDMNVIYAPADNEIVTAWPTNLPRNP